MDDLFFAFGKAVEEGGIRQCLSVAVLAAELVELLELLREQEAVQAGAALIRVIGFQMRLFFRRNLAHLGAGFLAAIEHLIAQLRPTARRSTELAAEELVDRVRDIELRRISGEVCRIDAGANKVQGEVAHNLGGWGDLGRTAQHLIDCCIGVLDDLEAVRQAKGSGLGTQVGQLTARNLVLVDAAGRARDTVLKRGVELAHGLPVGLEIRYGLQVDTGIALGLGERCNKGGQRRLRGSTSQWCGGAVHNVGTGERSRIVSSHLATGGIVRVHVHRQVEFLAQSHNQLGSGLRA